MGLTDDSLCLLEGEARRHAEATRRWRDLSEPTDRDRLHKADADGNFSELVAPNLPALVAELRVLRRLVARLGWTGMRWTRPLPSGVPSSPASVRGGERKGRQPAPRGLFGA